jgi:antirestriction protein ArdC
MTQTTQTPDTQEIPGGLALPVNVQTARPYQGGNILRLAAAAIEHGWRDMRFGGYNQLQNAGYQVRRGESSTEILAVIGTDGGSDASADAAPTDAPAIVEDAGDGGKRRGRGVRVLRVFNVEQCERMTPEQVKAAKARRAAKAEARKARKAAGKPARKGRKRKNRKKAPPRATR